ncbi:hypothetical protein CYMTET_12838 [Cymbomonas tetramitiformis]|uniref:Uncharacterized protein n=1 Tax=Cymbomonas tetramitiformis TaxID=36881 RepID=A0AAE0GJS7_9CHLO|nr:hypothetical protein CYMTET_12838 [Cymbomonas tetramitiformis]
MAHNIRSRQFHHRFRILGLAGFALVWLGLPSSTASQATLEDQRHRRGLSSVSDNRKHFVFDDHTDLYTVKRDRDQAWHTVHTRSGSLARSSSAHRSAHTGQARSLELPESVRDAVGALSHTTPPAASAAQKNASSEQAAEEHGSTDILEPSLEMEQISAVSSSSKRPHSIHEAKRLMERARRHNNDPGSGIGDQLRTAKLRTYPGELAPDAVHGASNASNALREQDLALLNRSALEANRQKFAAEAEVTSWADLYPLLFQIRLLTSEMSASLESVKEDAKAFQHFLLRAQEAVNRTETLARRRTERIALRSLGLYDPAAERRARKELADAKAKAEMQLLVKQKKEQEAKEQEELVRQAEAEEAAEAQRVAGAEAEKRRQEEEEEARKKKEQEEEAARRLERRREKEAAAEQARKDAEALAQAEKAVRDEMERAKAKADEARRARKEAAERIRKEHNDPARLVLLPVPRPSALAQQPAVIARSCVTRVTRGPEAPPWRSNLP